MISDYTVSAGRGILSQILLISYQNSQNVPLVPFEHESMEREVPYHPET